MVGIQTSRIWDRWLSLKARSHKRCRVSRSLMRCLVGSCECVGIGWSRWHRTICSEFCSWELERAEWIAMSVVSCLVQHCMAIWKMDGWHGLHSCIEGRQREIPNYEEG